MPAVSDATVYTLWWVAIGVLLVVDIVAAGLLHAIVRICQNLDWSVPEIWKDGKLTANNTVQLHMLGRVVHMSGEIRSAAGEVNTLAAAIKDHAAECQHCPACAAPPSPARARAGSAVRIGKGAG